MSVDVAPGNDFLLMSHFKVFRSSYFDMRLHMLSEKRATFFPFRAALAYVLLPGDVRCQDGPSFSGLLLVMMRGRPGFFFSGVGAMDGGGWEGWGARSSPDLERWVGRDANLFCNLIGLWLIVWRCFRFPGTVVHLSIVTEDTGGGTGGGMAAEDCGSFFPSTTLAS